MEINQPIQYTKCYIAFLDMLGFKNLVKEKTCEEINRIFKDFKSKPISCVYLGDKNIISTSTTEVLKMKIMSVSVKSNALC